MKNSYKKCLTLYTGNVIVLLHKANEGFEKWFKKFLDFDFVKWYSVITRVNRIEKSVYINYLFIFQKEEKDMSLKDKMEQAGVKTGKAPSTGKPAPVAGNSEASNKGAKFRADGALARQGMSEDQKALEGSKSDTVAFVATLGNPAKGQPRKKGGEYIPSNKVCGYQVKVLEDTMIPVAPLKEDCKDELDVQFTGTERPAKAGEIVTLNVVETAMFITRVEYAGTFSGEGKNVYISATISKSKADPSPCLRAADGSIKENMIMVAEMKGQKDGKGGHAEVKEEFKEQFAPLFRARSTRRQGDGSARKAGESIMDTAAAFRALYGSK